MQSELGETLAKIYRCASKQIMDLAELNITTLNNITSNSSHLEEITQSKRPEDFWSAQAKLAYSAWIEASKYSQRAFEIGLSAYSESGNLWAEVVNDLARSTSNFTTKPAGK